MEIVKNGYNQIAGAYFKNRERLKSGRYVRQLLRYLPKQASILDLGCGSGVGVDDILIKAGHRVMGIDIAQEQIKLARKYCPGGEFAVGDISKLRRGVYSVQAVVSFYVLFHVPRSEQGRVLSVIASYLDRGGMLLITMGDREFEGEHTLHGVPMWVSQWGTAKNRQIVEAAGFKILEDSIATSSGERHQVILAQIR